MKRFHLILLTGLLFGAACSCPEQEELPVESSDPFYVVGIDIDFDFYELRFSKPVDTATFEIGRTIFFGDGPQEEIVYESMNWSDDFSRVFFDYLSVPCDSFVNAQESCFIYINILGEKGAPLQQLRSMDPPGQVLDGDYDGSDGGNFRRLYQRY